jgi:hypothetical protein
MSKLIIIQWFAIAILLMYGVAATMAFENVYQGRVAPATVQSAPTAPTAPPPTTSSDQEVIQVARALDGWLGGPIGATQREIAVSARQFVRQQQQFCRDEGLGPHQENLKLPLSERNRCAPAFSVTIDS